MNILAIMGAHGVFYKDEPLRELDAALNLQGFQLLYPKNSDDLLKLIEHNPRISGVIFDWDPSLTSAAELITTPRGTDARIDPSNRRTTAERREWYHERMDAKSEARAELESERLAKQVRDEGVEE